MNYRRGYNFKRIKYFAPAILFVVLFLFAILTPSFGVDLPGHIIAASIARPIFLSKEHVTTSLSVFFELLRSKRSLILENGELRETLAERASRDLLNNLLQEENRELRQQLGRAENLEVVLARVLARPTVSLYDTLLVDAGREEGVKKGSQVRAREVIIGTIERVDTGSSLVSLFSTPGRETSVTIGEPPISAVAKGRGSGNFEVSLPRGVEIKEGDPVVLPSLSPSVFAVVEAISVSAADPFQTILFKNPVNLSEIRSVLIIKTP